MGLPLRPGEIDILLVDETERGEAPMTFGIVDGRGLKDWSARLLLEKPGQRQMGR